MNKLPDFVIAGERRSGSTTLYEVLKQHPEIGMHPISDLDYFIGMPLFSRQDGENAHDKNWEDKHSVIEYSKLFSGLIGVTGHKDADLLWWWPAHKRLANYLPDTKFIFVLREPSKRAESQYWNEFKKGRETLSFEEALLREEHGQLTPWQRLHLEYKERGCYVKSLQHFYQHIEKKRVLVVILENLFNNWDDEIVRICDFLGIDTLIGKNLKPVHSNKESVLVVNPKFKGTVVEKLINIYDRLALAAIQRIGKSKEHKNQLRAKWLGLGKISARKAYPVQAASIKDLAAFYAPCNIELATLTGLDLSLWQK